MDLAKIVKPVTDRQIKLEEQIDKMSIQLNEVHESMEILVSIILGDDTKKGEILKSKSKYTPEVTFPDYDENDDGGNKGQISF